MADQEGVGRAQEDSRDEGRPLKKTKKKKKEYAAVASCLAVGLPHHVTTATPFLADKAGAAPTPEPPRSPRSPAARRPRA